MRSVIRIFSVAFATLLLSLLVLTSQSVQAATLIVSTTADAGAGSLRQAIIDATTNAEANTITFNIPLADPGYDSVTDRFTITLVNQLPDLPLAPLSIDNLMGRGLTVKGNSSFRIFTLVNSAVVNLNNMTMTQGSSNGGLGGGIYMGDSAVLFLTNCVVTNNTASNGGGGIWMNDSGTLHLIDSTISNNTTATGNGGGIYINNSGTLNITSSTVSGNTATVGGGGGIYNGTSGTVNATNITVYGNSAGDLGGGILNNATATISSSTISGNNAASGGGGMYNNFTASLDNSLIALNTGADGPDLLGRGSRGMPYTGTSNLIGNADGCETFGPTTNQLGTTGDPINPLLGPLQDNGGPTFTMALLAGSPAVDAGITALATDQRGVSRPLDGDGLAGAQSDIGSFESEGLPEFTINDVTVAEPASGSTPAIFTITLSRSSNVILAIDFSTADVTASAGSDYTTAFGTVFFAPGETTHTVTITVHGDVITESAETFALNLSNAQGGARIPDSQGIGTILDTPAATPTPTPTPTTNDSFAGAQTISDCTGSVTGHNFGATKETNEPSHSPDGDAGGGSVWYQWQAPSSGSMTITTAGSDFDTVLAVYTGTSVNALTAVIKNNDADPGNLSTSAVTFNAISGTLYRIAVDGWGDARGNLVLNWTQSGCTQGKVDQTITFNALPGKSFGDNPFTVSATSSSDLVVSFSILSGPATISGNTITITGAGTVIVRASQAGDANFNAAADVDQSFTVAKSAQTITFNALSSKTYGDAPFNVVATSSSNLVVSFNILSGPATISGNTITITGVGTVIVQASQSGDSNYNAATFVDQPFTIVSANAAISLAGLSHTYDGTAKSAIAITNPPDLNVSITYSQNGSPVSAPTGSGTYDVTATITSPGYSGTTVGTLVINKATPLISWISPANILSGTPLGGAQLNATSSVAGNFSYDSPSGTILGAGTYQLSVTFTPLDTVNFNTVTASVQLTVDPTIAFSNATYSVNESGGAVTLTVTRSGDLTQAARVDFATSDSAGALNCNVVNGVASSRCDYEIRLKTIRFAVGESSKTVSVLIIDDEYFEGPEVFNVSLSNPVGGLLGPLSTATVSIIDNDTEDGVNPVDTAGFFARMQYLDFLNREPDADGLAFWTNEMTSCGVNPACLDHKRDNVSAAFYLSIEFQQTGFLVEHIYKAAYGDGTGTSTLGGAHQISVPIVRLLEFLRDTQAVGEGVVVNQLGWETVLETNKQALMAEFVQNARFTTAFPTSMTAAQFVDTLNTNAGSPLSAPERDQLVSELTTANKNRAQILRAIAEDPDMARMEFNRAYVLMQYFGYLRRNPNDHQDSDYTGYDFWLTKLNQFNGDAVGAEMVKAFITSIEYKQRFGK